MGRGQHDAYSLVFGFNRFNRQSNLANILLRFQAQAERLHRLAVEDFHRLFKLRDVLPPEKYQEPIEPIPEPKPYPKPPENTGPPDDIPPIRQSPNEPNADPPGEHPVPKSSQATPAAGHRRGTHPPASKPPAPPL